VCVCVVWIGEEAGRCFSMKVWTYKICGNTHLKIKHLCIQQRPEGLQSNSKEFWKISKEVHKILLNSIESVGGGSGGGCGMGR